MATNPPGIAKALIVRVANDEVVELVLAFLGLAREAVADFLRVLADFRIREDHACPCGSR